MYTKKYSLSRDFLQNQALYGKYLHLFIIKRPQRLGTQSESSTRST
jgi:hypothetical protein